MTQCKGKLQPAIRWRCAHLTQSQTITDPVFQKDRIKSVTQPLGKNTVAVVRITHNQPNVGHSEKPMIQRSFKLKAVRQLKTKLKQLTKDLGKFCFF